MTGTVRIALGQLNLVVGDVAGNVRAMVAAAEQARDQLGAHLVVFPELAVTGYPPEDLLFHRGFQRQVERALEKIADAARGIGILFGYPEYEGENIYNAARLVEDGRVLANYRKRCLPNYGVFDEQRYFTAGTETCVLDYKGLSIGLVICEDVWKDAPARESAEAGARLLLVINGSPYDTGRPGSRLRTLGRHVVPSGLVTLYVNMVGGQDELLFDGGSLVLDGQGKVVHQAPMFEPCLSVAEFIAGDGFACLPGEMAKLPEASAAVYRALVLGTRDYVSKHGFPGVVLGLSGGIDSALVLSIAVDALGADRVRAVMMPTRYTSDMSLQDAREQAVLLGVHYDVLPIEPIYEATLGVLAEVFRAYKPDVTEENIQARSRGMVLMAISNKTGAMLLTTGNKSEMSVGYATLYGDMAGGFAPIKDCSKTQVYRLARYRNEQGRAIPERVIEREPSAELRDDQKDTDSLPPYDVLDPILEAFIEKNLSVDEISALGYDHDTVARILELVKRNEYKRRQAPPGIRISPRAFGRDWRYPITSGFGPGRVGD
jgi:NAD+ synthase (glutamine-hydrolysing)